MNHISELPPSEIVLYALRHTVTDIGQLSRNQVKELNKQVKRGNLSKGRGGEFPKLKTVYAVKGYDFERSRAEYLSELFAMIEKLEPHTIISKPSSLV